jgi:hypothetical protein
MDKLFIDDCFKRMQDEIGDISLGEMLGGKGIQTDCPKLILNTSLG